MQNIRVLKLKGATIKGLCRSGNPNRTNLQNFLRNNCSTPFKCGLFNFGQVDIHLSYYYNTVTEFKKGLSAILATFDGLQGALGDERDTILLLQKQLASQNFSKQFCTTIENDWVAALTKLYRDQCTHYVDFIASLPTYILPRKVVLAVHPTAVAYFNVPMQLCKYGVLSQVSNLCMYVLYEGTVCMSVCI